MKNKKTILQNTAAVLLALCVWQAAAVLLSQKLLLASPLDVLVRLGTIWQEPGFFSAIWFSFSKIVCGFLLGLLCGVIFAVFAGRFHVVEILLRPYMLTIKSVPVASFIVIALIWLSSAKLSVFISFLIVLPIIYTNVLGGIKSVDPKMIEMADVFHISWGSRLRYIWMPQIKSYLVSACSVAIGLSWKSGIAAEVIGIPTGSIGEALYQSKVYLNTVDLFSWTVMIVLLSVLFEKLFLFLMKKGFAGLEKI